MSETNQEIKLLTRTRARNTSYYVGAKLTLRFSLLYFALFATGGLLTLYLLPHWSELQQSHVTVLTDSPFAECIIPRHYIEAVLRHSAFDLVFLVLYFTAGCTFFTTSAVEVLTGIHAFQFGSLMAAFALQAENNKLLFALCFITGLTAALFFICAASRTILFSYEFRHVGVSGHSPRARECLNYYLLYLAFYAGALILLHTLQCLITHMVYK